MIKGAFPKDKEDKKRFNRKIIQRAEEVFNKKAPITLFIILTAVIIIAIQSLIFSYQVFSHESFASFVILQLIVYIIYITILSIKLCLNTFRLCFIWAIAPIFLFLSIFLIPIVVFTYFSWVIPILAIVIWLLVCNKEIRTFRPFSFVQFYHNFKLHFLWASLFICSCFISYFYIYIPAGLIFPIIASFVCLVIFTFKDRRKNSAKSILTKSKNPTIKTNPKFRIRRRSIWTKGIMRQFVDKHQRAVNFMIFFLICMPMVFGVSSLAVVSDSEVQFALIPNDLEEPIDYETLEFVDNPNDLGEGGIPFNRKMVVKCSLRPDFIQSSRMLMTLKPKKVPEISGFDLKREYEFYTKFANGPGNYSTYIEVPFDELGLIPGKYDLEFQTYIQTGFTSRLGNSINHKLTLTKDNAKIIPNNDFNINPDIVTGIAYTVENKKDHNWEVTYTGKIVNSLDEPIEVGNLELYLQKNNAWQKIAVIETESDGSFNYAHKVFGSFEMNSLVKIIFAGNEFYNPYTVEEYAGLEYSLENNYRFFIDENGDGLIDWPYDLYDLIKALNKASAPPPSLAFHAPFEEALGLTTYDSVSNIEGQLIEDVSWAEGKKNSAIEFNTADTHNFVTSVEHLEFDIGWFSKKETVSLTKGQNIANCVPFVSKEITGLTIDDWDDIEVDVYFKSDGSGPELVAERNGWQGSVSLSVFVVEFDDRYVDVQPGEIKFSDLSSTNITSEVDLEKAAMTFYYKHKFSRWLDWFDWLNWWGCDDWDDYRVTGSFSDDHTLLWERGAPTGDIEGHYYIFEAKNDEFSVQPVTFNIDEFSTEGEAVLQSPVDFSKSFILSSYLSTTPNDDSQDGSCDVWLEDSTHVKAMRYATDNEITVNAFVIELNGDETVQHGTFDYGENVDDLTSSITPVNLDNAMIHPTIAGGNIRADQTCSLDVMRAYQKLTFVNSETIRGRNWKRDNFASGHWQVVEWDIADESGHIDFGDTLNDVFGSSHNEFVITAWVKPTSYSSRLSNHGTSNCFISKSSSSGIDNLEVGITEDGKLQLFLATDEIDTYGDYGVVNSIPINEWTFVAIIYDNNDVDVLIGDEWYNDSIGEAEPWQGALSIDSAEGSRFAVGATKDSNVFFTGTIDEVSVFREALSHQEVESYKSEIALEIEALVSIEDGFGGWAPISTSGQILDGWINFECKKSLVSVNAIDMLDFYISTSVPDLVDPTYEEWVPLTTFYDDRDYYSWVIDNHDLPDGDEYYFIIKAIDEEGNVTIDAFDIANQLAYFTKDSYFRLIVYD